MEYKDYYQILEVDRTSSVEDIEKAHRKLARRYHPDINPGDEVAEARFNEINEAHHVLTVPEARAKYERLNANWTEYRRSEATGEFDWTPWISDIYKAGAERIDLKDIANKINSNENGFSDFFEAIFGGITSAQEAAIPQKGQDYHQNVEVSLEEAFTGTTRILRVGDRRLEVKIPKGAKTGTKVRVRGEGAEGIAGGPKGDLYLEITIAAHPIFQWIDDDLHLELPVNLYSALLGGEAIVPMIKGKIKLKIPPETQSGRVFRLKGQGMPRLQNPEERGDLFAKVMVTLPENLTEVEIELFEQLADLRGL
jgi:curved DNA-binding protein